MTNAINFGGGNKVGFVSGLDYEALKAKKLSSVDRSLNKIQDDRLHAKEEIIEFARLKKDLNKLFDYTYSFSNPIFGASVLSSREVQAPKDLTDNYALIETENGARVSSYNFKIDEIATSEILESEKDFDANEKVKEGTITVTINDNGVTSNKFSSKYATVVSATNASMFKSGSFRIGDALVNIEEGNSLEDITRKINQAAIAYKENIVAEVKDNGRGSDYYIWIKTRKLGDGENTAVPFKISDDKNILNQQFNRSDSNYQKNEKVEIKLNQEMSVSDFVNKFNSYSKKTYITATLENKDSSKQLLRFQSTVTGANNKINLEGKDSQGNDLLGQFNVTKRTSGKNTKVNFGGEIKISSTNRVNHNGVQVTAMRKMKEPVAINIVPSAKGFEELQEIYNALTVRIAKNTQKKESAEEYYKYADSAALSEHHFWLSNIQNNIQELFSRMDKEGNSLLNFGITFTEIPLNPEEYLKREIKVKEGKEQEDLQPVNVFLMEIDKEKIQMNIDKVMNLLGSDFQSSEAGFHQVNAGVDLHTQRVSDFDYNIDFSKAEVKSNLSKQFDDKTSVLGIKENGIVLLNGEKIELTTKDTLQTFVDKVNKIRHKSGIKALIADEKQANGDKKYRILLDKNYNSEKAQEYEIQGKTEAEIRDIIRGNLNIFDKGNILNDIFGVQPIDSKSFSNKDFSDIVSGDTSITINGVGIPLKKGMTLSKVQEAIEKGITDNENLKGRLKAEVIKNGSVYNLQLVQTGVLEELKIEDQSKILFDDNYSKSRIHPKELSFYDTTNISYVRVNLLDGNAAEKFSYMKLKDPLDIKKGGDIRMIDSIDPAPMQLKSSATFSKVDKPLDFNGEIEINGKAISITSDMSLDKVKEEINKNFGNDIWADIVKEEKDAFRIVLRKSDVNAKLEVVDKSQFFRFSAPSNKLRLKDFELRYAPKGRQVPNKIESKISIHQGITELISNYIQPMIKEQGTIDVMVREAQESEEYAKSQESVLKDRKKQETKRFDYEMGIAEGKFDKYNQQLRFIDQWTKDKK